MSSKEEHISQKKHELIGQSVFVGFCPEDLEYQPECEKEYEGKIINFGQNTLTEKGSSWDVFYLDVKLCEPFHFQGKNISILSQTSDSFWRVILSIVLAIVLLPFLFILGKIIDVIRLRRYRRRRKTTLWQAPVSNDDFLRGCGIAPDSQEARIALLLRQTIAEEVSAWCHKITMEEIAPDMTGGELVLGWEPYMYGREGYYSVGWKTAKRLTKGKISEEKLEQLIQPEEKTRVTMRELFRNYLDVLMPYLANADGTEVGK